MMHLKRYSCLLMAFCSLALLAQLQADDGREINTAIPDWQILAMARIEEPLKVDIRWNVDEGQAEPGMILRLDDGNVTFVQNSGGQASVKRDSLGKLYFGAKYGPQVLSAMSHVDSERFTEEDLELLREVAYPMCRFLSIPEANCNLHRTVLKFCKGLIQLGHLEEAAFYFQYIPMDLVGLNFEEQALRLTHRLLDESNIELAISVVKGVPVEQINAANLVSLAEVAHRLRELGYYQVAKVMYRRIMENPEQPNDEPLYWTYYCEIALNEAQADHSYVQKISGLNAQERFFSLQQLIAGRYYLDRNFLDEAMRAIAQGIAFAKPVDRWTPELMYYSYKAYLAMDMPEVAFSVLGEVVLFFPNSHWASEARKLLPEESAAAQGLPLNENKNEE